jgi:hypothetical protein
VFELVFADEDDNTVLYADIVDDRVDDIVFNTCNAPWLVGDTRGAYFNGLTHSVDFDDLFLDMNFAMMWLIRPEAYEFTLFRAALTNTCPHDPDYSELEVWVNRCGHVVVDFLGHRFEYTDEVVELNAWNSIGVYLSSD